MNRIVRNWKFGIYLGVALSVLAGQTATAEEAEHAEQAIRSTEGFVQGAGERGAATSRQLKEQRTAAVDIVTKPRASLPSASVGFGEQWIFDADAALYDDLDGDGYFRYLSVRFDADTYLSSVYVYAMLYLSADGQTWEHFYTTEDFLIGGTVPDDEYFVETDLLTGYPPGLYDVLIELYDADFGTLSDEFGPNESSALSLLPLEDAGFDQPAIAVTLSSGHGGGGSISFWMLPALLLGYLWQSLRRGRRSLAVRTRRTSASS
jgi:type II secretory pathway pseudopilin PulG